MGNSPRGGGFQIEMLRMWTSDHDCKKTGGEKYKRNTEKDLKSVEKHGIICLRDIFYSLLLVKAGGQRPKGGNKA